MASLSESNKSNEERSLPERDADFSRWIVSAPFDLLFLINFGWPLLLVPGISTGSDTAVDFWQVYFLTLPHRWITLLLVLVDRDRRGNQGFLLLSLTIALACIVTGSYLGSGAFLCLGLVDYVWNGWHFASQHAGVLRIYSRKVSGGNEWLERWGLRGFIVYVILRSSGGLIWQHGSVPIFESISTYLDFAILFLPASILITNLQFWSWERLPKLLYLVSVLLLYSGYLLATHFHWSRLILGLASAASMFHAIEYLAIVSHYAQRRERIGSTGMMRQIALHWLSYFTIFLVSLGAFGVWISNPLLGYESLWQGLNLWAAFTHYAFDGLIWKLRRPETSRALGAS